MSYKQAFDDETHQFYDEESPAVRHNIPKENQRPVCYCGGESIDKASAFVDTYGGQRWGNGTLVLEGKNFAPETLFLGGRLCLESENLHSRGGTVIAPAEGFDSEHHLLVVRRADVRKVNYLWSKWKQAGSDPKKKPKRGPNYNGGFSLHYRNIEFSGKIAGGGGWSHGVVFGGGQCSSIRNCYFRFFRGYALQVGNSSCRTTLEETTIEHCNKGIELRAVSTGVRLIQTSFVSVPIGIHVFKSEGVVIDGISSEACYTPLSFEGSCKNIEAKNLSISLHRAGYPIVDFSKLTGYASDRGIRVTGTLRKQMGASEPVFWIDRSGNKQIIPTGKPSSNNYSSFSIAQ